MSNIEMGKQYRTVNGKKARVICLDWKGSNLPVLALVEINENKEALYSYNIEGRYYSDGDSEFDLVEYDPAMDLKVDQPIWVRDSDDDEWVPRYFAKYQNGKIYAFSSGTTSFTCSSNHPRIPFTSWKQFSTTDPNL